MTQYYVRATGNNANDGLSAGAAKLTIQAAVNLATTAGDIVNVGAGIYREMVTLAASGSVGSPITIRGDYAGTATGDAGEVVVSAYASETATSPTRASCFVSGVRTYNTISNFVLDGGSSATVTFATSSDCILENCVSRRQTAKGIYMNGATNWIVRRCLMMTGYNNNNETFNIEGTGGVCQSCIIVGGHRQAYAFATTVGATLSNCLFIAGGGQGGVYLQSTLVSGTVNVNNCIFHSCQTALRSNSLGNIVEDYNGLSACLTSRTNVGTGANSVAYDWVFDPRTWLESAVANGTLLTPFDLDARSAYVELNSGTGAPSTDMRGASVTGTYREWGPAEYNAALDIEGGGGIVVSPLGQALIQAIMGGGG